MSDREGTQAGEPRDRCEHRCLLDEGHRDIISDLRSTVERLVLASVREAALGLICDIEAREAALDFALLRIEPEHD